MKAKTANGGCYRVHANALIEGAPGLLCHGTVWHPKVGWHGHCWVELNEDIVMDLSSGHRVVLSREVYYAAGKVRDVRRYTVEQARELMLREGSYGPWKEI